MERERTVKHMDKWKEILREDIIDKIIPMTYLFKIKNKIINMLFLANLKD